MRNEMEKRRFNRPHARLAFALLLLPVLLLAGILGFACELPTHARDFDTAAVTVDGGITCPSSQTLCTGAGGAQTCSDLTDDPSNCGGCGVACPATESCLASDAGATCGCGGSTQLCGTTCLDLSSSPNNCGACGHTCGADTICASGTCVTTCQSGQTNCDDSCINVAIDTSHCGECDHGCAAGTICSAATCVVSDGGCGTGLTSCTTSGVSGCVDLTADSKNCGGCNVACGSGQECFDAGCTCSSGLTSCMNVCNTCPTGGVCTGTACICAPGFSTSNDAPMVCCYAGTKYKAAIGLCCNGSSCCAPGKYLCASPVAGTAAHCEDTLAACGTATNP